MRKLLTGVAMAALSMSIAGCDQRAAENADVAAEANTEVLVDENAAMDANVMVDENAAMNADEATENVTEQGSTDH